MCKLKYILLLIIGLNIHSSLFSQGFTPPADSNAVVYFVRLSGYGSMTSFQYFHNRKIIGMFKGKNYIRYECPAGKNLLWASSENKEFLNCDLKAGQIYVVVVNIEQGTIKPRVDLEPIAADYRYMKRVKKLVNNDKPIVTPLSVLNLNQEKLDAREFIEVNMERYQNEWKNSSFTNVITPDMFIPIEALK